jgi:hypothetical protein
MIGVVQFYVPLCWNPTKTHDEGKACVPHVPQAVGGEWVGSGRVNQPRGRIDGSEAWRSASPLSDGTALTERPPSSQSLLNTKRNPRSVFVPMHGLRALHAVRPSLASPIRCPHSVMRTRLSHMVGIEDSAERRNVLNSTNPLLAPSALMRPSLSRHEVAHCRGGSCRC